MLLHPDCKIASCGREEVLDEMDDQLVPPPHRNPNFHAAMQERIRQLETRRAIDLAREQAREQVMISIILSPIYGSERQWKFSVVGWGNIW